MRVNISIIIEDERFKQELEQGLKGVKGFYEGVEIEVKYEEK